MASVFFNKLTFRLRPLTRRFYGTGWFIAFTAFYFRRVIPVIRRFIPLYGVTAVLSLTYRCQCSCKHCGAGLYRKRQEEEFTPGEIFKFIDDLARLGGACVHFFGGEPLMVPQLPEYVSQTRRRGMMATVDTNGLLLTEEMVLKLKKAGIALIRVSLDSPDEAAHDANRGVAGSWKKAVDGLRHCVRNGVPCFMGLYATRENLASGDFERMIALAREIGAGVRFLSSVQSGRLIKREDVRLSPAELEKLRGLLAEDVCWETEFLQHKNVPFWCNSILTNKFDISPYGDVLACCYMPVNFGNVRKEPLETILHRMWESDMFNDGLKHHDCPMNNPEFLRRYGSRLDTELEDHPASK